MNVNNVQLVPSLFVSTPQPMEQRVRRCPCTMEWNFREPLMSYLKHVLRASILHDPGLGLLRIIIYCTLTKCILKVLAVKL